jgi:hypothetical protein
MVAKTTVYGLYKNRSNVEEAVGILKLNGFGNADISVLIPENQDSKDVAPDQHITAAESAVTGGGSGAVVGGTLGGLAGISLLAVPFIGPFIAAGSMLAGAGVGGTVGTIVGALNGMGVPDDEVKRYEGHFKGGGLLVSVHCDSLERVKRAKDLLKKTGATDVSSVGEADADFLVADEPSRRSIEPGGMLRNTKDLQGFSIRATDGEIGTVKHFYFDDDTWVIRYLTVDTGDWLGDRLVLISPISIIGQPDSQSKRLDVSLTKRQVENSPYVDTLQPMSRQHEITYLGYYGYPYYWGGSDLWGPVPYPAALAVQAAPLMEAPRVAENRTGSYLRSTQEVTGYCIEAPDGEIGHLDGFVIDDKTWAIRYIEVATRNWWPGKKVLVSPAWIERLSWADSKVYVEFSRETIKNGPQYTESAPVNREYENQLYSHYGRRPYWLHGSEHRPPQSLSGV